jgi:mono/diheme cytochrome c family protein
MKLARPVPLIATVLLFSQSAHAGSPEHGRILAENWCSSCHVVSAGQSPSGRSAPPFTAIAQLSDFSADRLAYLLRDPHPKMAKLGLSRKAIEDIADYIKSLGR